MSTYTQIFYHIIFSTKNRDPVLDNRRRNDLFRYIWGVIRNNQCHAYRIGGVRDHVHILTSLHPVVSLSDLVKDIKTGSSHWIKEEGVFPKFSHWQEGYGAFTHSISEKDTLVEYIKAQAEHHKKVPFVEEYRRILLDAGVEFDERYLS